MLDLLYTSNPQSFSPCKISIIDPESDHHMATFQITYNTASCIHRKENRWREKIPEIATYNIPSANKANFSKALNDLDWESEIGPPSEIQHFNQNFVKAIVKAAKTAEVPKYKESDGNRKTKSDPTLDRLTQTHQRLNNNLQNKALTDTDRANITEQLRNNNTAIRERMDTMQEEEETKIANEVKTNTKAFFDYANRNIKVKAAVGPLKEGKHFYDGPKKMAEILSSQYQSAFSKPLEDYSHISFATALCTEMSDLNFTVDDIKAAIKAMCVSSAPGPDGVSAFLLKEYVDCLAAPLHYIWRTSLDTGLMPEGTLQSIITPIYKGGDRSIPKNYRPVWR